MLIIKNLWLISLCIDFAVAITTHPIVCKSGFFPCANETVCVPQSAICDGILDCESGSDELNCIDDNINLYYDNKHKKRVGARNDDLGDECLFGYNGTVCQCKNFDILCGFRSLTAIPADLIVLPSGDDVFIDLIDFEANNFGKVDSKMLASLPKQIYILNFAHCNINEIGGGAFEQFTQLIELHLDNNKLNGIPLGIFGPTNKLQTLSLRYNQIEAIDAPNTFAELQQLTELDLSGNKLQAIKGDVFAPLTNLTKLHLENNQLKTIGKRCFPAQLSNLEMLWLSQNRIETIEGEAFANLEQLQHLYLSGNHLISLNNSMFDNLHNLIDLMLEENALKTIEKNAFIHCENLKSLILSHNQFSTLSSDIFKSLNLDHIVFDSFELCASAEKARNCEPKGDGISSQFHLLDNSILRASVWIMATIGCTGNLIVLLGRLLAPITNNVVHSLYLRNLAMSDLLMGIYLFVIASVDYGYRGDYLRYEYAWRHSFTCNLCGFLSTLSCESSVLILTLVTWDRYVSVTQPLARKQPSPRTATLTLLFLWLVAATLSLIPFSRGYFGDEFYGNNGVCLPLHIHEPYAKGWEYSAAMFMLTNALALTFICYAYLRMIRAIKASGVACRSTRQSQERDKVAQRFGIIVLTDSLCWVPIIIVKLIALTGHSIHENLYAWLAIFILPINSALNPVLYTLTTTVFKKQMRKVLNNCVRKRRKQDNSNVGSESGFSLSFGVFPIGGSTRRILSYRGTQSSLTTSKNSWKRPPTAV